jgi:hypothetical protein
MIRKPSVYADNNEPTAVYDAALSGVCQWKNWELFHLCLVFLNSPNGVSSKKIAAAAFLASIKANPSPDAPWESL